MALHMQESFWNKFIPYFFIVLLILTLILTFTIYPNLLKAEDHPTHLNITEIMRPVFSKNGEDLKSFSLNPDIKISPQEFFSNYGSYFGLTSQDTTRKLHTETDEQNNNYIRYSQFYNGVEVLGAQYILKEQDDRVVSGTGKFITGLDLNTTPAIDEAAAFANALAAAPARQYLWDIDKNFTKPGGKLLLVPTTPDFKAENYKLAYVFEIRAEEPYGYYNVKIDANSGELIEKMDAAKHYINEYNIDLTTVPSLYDKNVDLKVVEYENSLNKNEMRLGVLAGNNLPPIETYCTKASDDFVDDNYDKDFTDHNNPECTQSEPAINVHWGTQQFFQYMSSPPFNRIGIDGAGLMKVKSFLHTKFSTPAQLDKVDLLTNQASFEFNPVGDGITFAPAVSLDIVAHELMHGITAYVTQNGSLQYCNENASLDESWSDIFGVLVKNKVAENLANPQVWTLGETISINAPYFRNLAAPKALSHPNTYQGIGYITDCNVFDPHVNAGVSNYWFYLLAHGGKGHIDDLVLQDNSNYYEVEGLGVSQAAEILYKTIVQKMNPASGFMDARLGSIEVAIENFGYGSKQHKAVANAWYAVGVGDEYSSQNVIYYPTDGQAYVEPWPATIKWSVDPLDPAIAWEVQVSMNPSFDPQYEDSPNLYSSIVSSLSLENGIIYAGENFNLNTNTTYYWRYRYVELSDRYTVCPDADNCIEQEVPGPWSLTKTFKTDSRTPILRTPSDKSKDVHPWSLEYKWEEVDGAKSYIIHTSENDPSFTNPLVLTHDPVKNGTQVEKTDLKIDTSYYWKVRAIGPDDMNGNPTVGDWSNNDTGYYFQTGIPETTLISPINDEVGPWNINLQWEETKGAGSYIVDFSKYSDFHELIDVAPKNSVNTHSLTVNLPLPQDIEITNETFYWRVTPVGPDLQIYQPLQMGYETGKTSDVAAFVVNYDLTKPTLLTPAHDSSIVYGQNFVDFDWTLIDAAGKYHLKVWINGSSALEMDYIYDSLPPVSISGITSDTTVGEYCWSITAYGPEDYPGLESDMSCYYLAPDMPELISPADGTEDVPFMPTTFTWKSNYAPKGYKIIWDDGEMVTGEFAGMGTSFTKTLEPDTTYHWKIEALGKSVLDNAATSYSEFTTEPLIDTPVLLLPANGATLTPGNITLKWDSDYAPLGYTVFLTETLNQISSTTTEFTDAKSSTMYAKEGATYTWYVKALSNGPQPEKNSAVWSFQVPEQQNNNNNNSSDPIDSPLAFELTETSNDDFDLIIQEPDGDVIHYYDSGNYVQDTVHGVGPDVAYWSNPSAGTYAVFVHVYSKLNFGVRMRSTMKKYGINLFQKLSCI